MSLSDDDQRLWDAFDSASNGRLSDMARAIAREAARTMQERCAKICEVAFADAPDEYQVSETEAAWNDGYDAACRSNAFAILDLKLEE